MAGEFYETEGKRVEQFNEIIKLIRQHKAKNKMAQNALVESMRVSTPEKLDEELVNEMKAICKIEKIEQVTGELGISA